MKLFVAYPFTEEQLDTFREVADVIYYRNPYEVSDLQDVDTMVAFMPFAKHSLSDFPKLEMLQLLSAGINQVSLEDLSAQNVQLANAKGIYSVPIAEWIVMRLLEAKKRSFDVHELHKAKKWEQWMDLPELNGSKIGLVGTGNIAKETVARLTPFQVELVGFNTKGSPVDGFATTYPLSTLKDHVSDLDALVICTPETPGTRGYLNKDVLANVKKNLILINIGRGSAIVEEDLIEFLHNTPTALAILDVFAKEPLAEDHPLWTMPNVWISPHISASSAKTNQRLFELALGNLRKRAAGTPIVNEIDKSRGY